VSYRCTGTSRFVEFFRRTGTKTFPSASPVRLDPLGLDPREVVITDTSATPPKVLVQGVDYIVDAPAGEISVLTAAFHNKPLDVTWAPTDTVLGPPHGVHVLASARPAAPKVVKVTPAWSVSPAEGSLSGGGINYSRVGGYLRVYLDRPWFSSGADELLGVVAMAAGTQSAAVLTEARLQWVTTMALGPISVSSANTGYLVSPASFSGTASVPSVPYRPAYSSPPELELVEDTLGQVPGYYIWPYEVRYDNGSGLWFADVGITVGSYGDAPPPGYFVRLALVRFQPYAFPGAEISTVTLATFAQPVVDRSVSVTEGEGAGSVTVTVSGPGYYGYRPVQSGTTQYDTRNPDSPQPYSYPYTEAGVKPLPPTSSMMLVDVQVQDTSKGLSGDLAWATATGSQPVALEATFSGAAVTWKGSVTVPTGPSATATRLRISEVDYPTSTPTVVNTSLRRPFVAFVPLPQHFVTTPVHRL
jgi:hypothetical protein